jgi:hypothetical protein
LRIGHDYDLGGLQKRLKWAGYRVDLVSEPLTLESLLTVGIVILTGEGYAKGPQYTNEEISAVARFVASGGGLLCAAQAWSWSYPQYGDRPIELFPMNVLGRELGFHISGMNITQPNPDSAERQVFGSFRDWRDFEQWPPSRVDATAEEVQSALKDQDGRVMAVFGKYGRGRFVVLGHERMLEFNPEIGLPILEFVRPM